MSTLISFGSGKGGVGKSIICSNLCYLFAQQGLTVTLVDLDMGGANLHILFGIYKPKVSLNDFVNKDIKNINDLKIPIDGITNAHLIAGKGDTLQMANLPWPTKQKIIRHLRQIKSDIVLIDIGAGTHLDTLDFFLSADIHCCITTPDPTAIVDVYRFIRLAATRKALSSFLARDKISQVMKKEDLFTIEDMYNIAREYGYETLKTLQASIEGFHPQLIFNQTHRKNMPVFVRLKSLLANYLQIDGVELIGEIPEDGNVRSNMSGYFPISNLEPNTQASLALEQLSHSLLKKINTNHAKN